MVCLFITVTSFAIILPNGQDANVKSFKETNGFIEEIVLATPIQISTACGDFTMNGGSTISFYENGNIKKLIFSEVFDVKTPCGILKVIASKETPMQFYESGNLKQILVFGVSPVQIETPIGTMKCRQKKPLTFYENGNVESFYPSYNQSISFFPGAQFYDANILSFYQNGNVKEFTPTTVPESLKAQIKPKMPIGLTETGSIASFVPVDGTTITINETTFILYSGQPLEFYENKNYKKFTIDCTGKDFSIGGTLFSSVSADNIKKVKSGDPLLDMHKEGATLSLSNSQQNDGTKPQIVMFELYENGNLKSARIFSSYKTAENFTCQYDNDFLSAAEIILYENGVLNEISYSPALQINSEKDKYTSYKFWKSYYNPEGKEICRIGAENKVSPQGSFYSTSETALFFVTDGKITRTITAKVSATSKVFFDSTYKPIAYTVSAGGNKPMIKKDID